MTRKYEIPLSFANFRFKKIFVRGKKLLFFHFDCVFAGIHLWTGRDQRWFALIKHTAFFRSWIRKPNSLSTLLVNIF
ncbi:hypothetical protein JCM6292_213 [Bacteroides pyogenes JCM 6292]|uniref:Uncharacterized protein n=1 Tax=Bacteroides pyogenes JCM 6292 TaxID=1235809 RepID=W4P3B6_9BACE|nr:hypothetical protein JCM6292_213 [Bacteroides pyogenes JCM 6292]